MKGYRAARKHGVEEESIREVELHLPPHHVFCHRTDDVTQTRLQPSTSQIHSTNMKQR
jgi:hypothetical protein